MDRGEEIPVFRGMTRSILDAAYNNLAAVPDNADYIARWTSESERIRRREGARLDVRYGDAPRACLDYLPCGAPDAPLFIFIHGGYWQRNHKDMFAFTAEGPLAAGIDVALIGYSLAPDASLSEIVGQVRSAASYLTARSREFGFRSDRMIAGGWSAGAHLAAMMLGHPGLHGVLAISGIFDLEPMTHCYVNDALRLTGDEVERLSPIKLLSPTSAPVRVAYGEHELPELKRQSVDFAQAAQMAGLSVVGLPVEGHNHYSILDELGGGGVLLRELCRMAKP